MYRIYIYVLLNINSEEVLWQLIREIIFLVSTPIYIHYLILPNTRHPRAMPHAGTIATTIMYTVLYVVSTVHTQNNT